MQPIRGGTMRLYMVSSIRDFLSTSKTSSCHWTNPKCVPTTQGHHLEVRHSLLGMPGREGRTLWSEQAGCLFLCASKIGQQSDRIVRCSHDQPHQPRHWGRWQAHARRTGTPPPQGPLLLLWHHHRLPCPRLSQLAASKTCRGGSRYLHCYRRTGGDH